MRRCLGALLCSSTLLRGQGLLPARALLCGSTLLRGQGLLPARAPLLLSTLLRGRGLLPAGAPLCSSTLLRSWGLLWSCWPLPVPSRPGRHGRHVQALRLGLQYSMHAPGIACYSQHPGPGVSLCLCQGAPPMTPELARGHGPPAGSPADL